jgi:putative NADH-flavin reductase
VHVGIIGITGNIGQRVAREALERGHRITGFTRDVTKVDVSDANVIWKPINALDADSVRRVIGGLDVLISLYQPGNASKDFNDTVARSIADPMVYAAAAKALLSALNAYPRTRLIVVGGAGSLEISPGVTRADSSDQLRESLALLGLPGDYEVAVRGHRDALNIYRQSNRLWTYLSPAEQIYAGERTGRFRLGGDQPVVDASGESRISFEDAAVALIDEVELPRYVQRRFTIGY